MGSIEEQFISYWLASSGRHKTYAPKLHQQLVVFFCTFQQHRMPPDARGHGRLELQTLVSLCQIYHSELILFNKSRTYLVFLIRPTLASIMQNLCYTVIQLHICHLWMCNYGVTAGSRPIDVHLLQRRRSDPCHGDAIGTSGSMYPKAFQVKA